MTHLEVSFAPCDRLNPGFGYSVLIQNARTGAVMLRTAQHPVTGEALTLQTCIEVISMYIKDTAK